MIYVASPYSSPIPELVESRYSQVCEFVDKLILDGHIVFSPIVYCHPIAKRTGGGTDALTWMRFNMSILRRADALFLLQLPGWEKSQGVKVELNVCEIVGIPIIRFNSSFELLQ